MRSFLRTPLIVTAAAVAAVGVYLGLTLPPPAKQLAGTASDTQVAGAYHIHTSRSDGTGTVDAVAAAAAKAGLRFVIFTDHGDGTRGPDPPSYRHGVLCIDALEVSTDGGHVVALGLAGATPYPLAGRPRDVIDDIHRLGGVAVIAHPDSPKAGLRWRGQNVAFDGIEWLNADSEWRDDSTGPLLGTAARSLIRPAEAMASLFERPVRTLQRWDAAASARPVFGLAALDAHARIPWRGDEESRGATLLALPSYVAMFRTLAQVADLAQPLTGDAVADAARVLGALTSGHSFSIVRALAGPASLEFTAERQHQATMRAGDRLPASIEVTTFRARVPEAPGVRLELFHNGQRVVAGHGTVEHVATAPGVYRVEVAFPGASVPWILSNPITIGSAGMAPGEPGPPDEMTPAVKSLAVPLDPAQWTIEREPTSEGRLGTASGGGIQFDYRLASGVPRGQYAALVNPVRREARIDRVQFTARASGAMRLSVQVRLPGSREGQRWRQSAYIDPTPRTVVLRLQDFEPADVSTSRQPIAAPLHALLFVVDTVNTLPGTAGTVWISDVRLGLVPPPSDP